MVDKRRVTGELHGEILAHLLNQKVEKRDRKARSLQGDLRRLFISISALGGDLAKTHPGVSGPSNVKKTIDQLNVLLKTCKEYPQVFLGEYKMRPFLHVEHVPAKRGLARRDAISAISALVRYGLLDRVRKCQRTIDEQGNVCGIWFFAKKSDSKYHSRACQTRSTEELKRKKREYARRRYWRDKERKGWLKGKMRGGAN